MAESSLIPAPDRDPIGFESPHFNDLMRLGIVATLRLVEDSLERCWDCGQTGGVVREHSLEGLSKLRAVIGVLEQVKP